MSVANQQVAGIIERLNAGGRANVRLYPEHYHELIEAADLVLVASGTTTLDVAFHRTPMIVMYNTSRAFYHLIGRWMIRTPHLSLPNILARREIVPEFMPFYRSTEPIAQKALELLRSEDLRHAMIEALNTVVEPLRGYHASDRTAALLLGMIEHARH